MSLLSYIIEAKDKTSGVLSKIQSSFSELGTSFKDAMKGLKEGSLTGVVSLIGKIGPAVAVAGAAMRGLGAAVQYLGEGLASAAQLETFTIRLSKVTGSMDSARNAMRALTQDGNAVDDLFGEDDVLQAAIALKKLSDGALGTSADIKVLAGAAYDTGTSVSSVAQEVGALTGMITEGVSGWERYAKGLAKSGVLSFETTKRMSDMKEAGKSAGEIVAYMWDELNKQHSGSIDAARDSISGLSKQAEDSMGDMKRILGETIGKPFAALWNGVKIGFSETVSFMFGGLKDLAQFIGTFAGALAGGKGIKDAIEATVDNYDANHSTKEKSPGDLTATVNAQAGTSEEQKTADKKAADAHAELLKKKEEAQKKFDETNRTRAQQLAALDKEGKNIQSDMNFNVLKEGTDARIEAETRLLEINAEILKIKKDIAAEDKKKASEDSADRREKSNKESKSKSERLVEQSQYKYHAAYDKMTPDQQLAQTNKNIGNWQKNVARAKSEEEKKVATDGLVSQLQERDRLQKEAAAKDKERAKENESLMQRDREIRESKMTPEQKMTESKKRQADLEKQFDKETDPDKKLALRGKLMDEAEKQAGIEKDKPGSRSMSIGDVFEKAYKQGGKKDPAREQVELSRDIKRLLEKIEKKPGGMAA